MAVKLVAIDLDDTLLDSVFHISQAGKAAIKEAVGQGVVVTIASGRMFSAVLPIADELGIDVPLITYNGALIKSARSKEVSPHLPVPCDTAREVIRYAMENNLHINAYIDDVVYVNKMSEEAIMYRNRYDAKMVVVDDLLKFVQQDPTKLLIIAREDIAKSHVPLLRARFGDRLNIAISLPTFVEIVNKGASKGQALMALAGRFGIKREETMAIGDSENDIEMLKAAGLGVAVANASDEVKAEADYVTRACDGEGVAEAFDAFVL